MSQREGRSEADRLEPAAVAALYARHAEELRAYLTGLLRDPDLAAEVLQSAFAKAVERGHTARDGSARAWLFRVAHNEAMDCSRRAAAETRIFRKLAWWKRPGRQPAQESPEEDVGRRETAERVRWAIETLPKEQREVVRLRIYEDKTFAEIAILKGVPLGTILTRMRLATKKLADALRGELES